MQAKVEHLDVIVVGAGLAGVGAADWIRRKCPGKSLAVFEARSGIGGTWDLFRYPGIRCDSDIFTLAYGFRPWRDEVTMPDGFSVLKYIQETASERGLDRLIRVNHRVTDARWSSAEARWSVTVESGERYTCHFLYLCSGYYRYDRGHQPQYPGQERFKGSFIHPQSWPQGLSCAGRKVVVIGSGATAVSLVPALAQQGAQVTMLQRTANYLLSLPSRDALALKLRKWLPERAVHHVMRLKHVIASTFFYHLFEWSPGKSKKTMLRRTAKDLPPGIDLDPHFSPTYALGTQRLLCARDGDFFTALGNGQADVVTDEIETLTEDGIVLKSGKALQADVIVSATGLEMLACGGIRMEVDGVPVDYGQKLCYRALMLEGVPNLAVNFGYITMASVLRVGVTAPYVCRLLNHMARKGYSMCVARNDDPGVKPLPMLHYASGYIQRGAASYPKQGSKGPWRLPRDYLSDRLRMLFVRVEDGTLRFSRPAGKSPAPAAAPEQASAEIT